MRLTPELIVAAYARGMFPMAESAHSDAVQWFQPRRRGIIPLPGGFHLARSLVKRRRQIARAGGWRFSCDGDFAAVMSACADRPETWINPEIARVFKELHALGVAHSIELRSPDGALAGGVYGLALAGAFFAESMVSPQRDGSKLVLGELVARLEPAGFQLLDTQYLTPHLATLGGIEVSGADYARRLERALAAPADGSRAFAPTNPAAPDGAFWVP